MKPRKPIRKISAKMRLTKALDLDWKVKVLARDGWCWFKSMCWGPMDAHHIKTKAAHPKLRHEVSNGICLCRVHHRWAHDHPAEFKKLLGID